MGCQVRLRLHLQVVVILVSRRFARGLRRCLLLLLVVRYWRGVAGRASRRLVRACRGASASARQQVCGSLAVRGNRHSLNLALQVSSPVVPVCGRRYAGVEPCSTPRANWFHLSNGRGGRRHGRGRGRACRWHWQGALGRHWSGRNARCQLRRGRWSRCSVLGRCARWGRRRHRARWNMRK
jgi:hypothetical protein